MAEITSIWEMVANVRHAVNDALAPDGFVYVQNEGPGYATQPHLHVHLVPRYADDPLRDMWESDRPSADHGELRRVASLLAAELDPH